MKKQKKVYLNNAMKNPVLLITVADAIKTKIVEGLLNESDIPYFTRDNSFGGYIKVIMGSSIYATDFYVNKTDFPAAKEIIDAYFGEDEIEIEVKNENDVENENENEFDKEDEKSSHRKSLLIRIILGVFLIAFVVGTIYVLIQMFGK